MYCVEYEGYLLALDIGYIKKKGAVNFFVGPHALLAVFDRGLGGCAPVQPPDMGRTLSLRAAKRQA